MKTKSKFLDLMKRKAPAGPSAGVASPEQMRRFLGDIGPARSPVARVANQAVQYIDGKGYNRENKVGAVST